MRSVQTNVFDDIHGGLDQNVFSGTDLRPSISKFDIKLYFRGLQKQLGVIGMEWADLYFTGSLTTYQYGETSDADHSVFPDYEKIWKHLNIDPDTCRKQLIEMSIDHLDGTFLPGTQHPIQYFVMPYGTLPGDVFKPGLRSAWSLFDNKWLVPPEKNRVHDVRKEYPEIYARAAAIADKLTQMLDAGNIDAAKEVWHNVHKKRQLDQRAGLGDFSEGNITLKWLLHEGIIDRLRNEGGMVIQTSIKFSMPPAAQAPDFMKQWQVTPTPSVPFAENTRARGYDWMVDENAIKRLQDMEQYGAPAMWITTFDPADPKQRDPWLHLLGLHQWKSKMANIGLHPFQTVMEANNTLWHEIQHAYQEIEGRMENMQNYNWKDPTSDDQYTTHPVEIDAVTFAQYMQHVPLIVSAPVLNNPDWVPNELHLDMGDWDEQEEMWRLPEHQLAKELQAQVAMFRKDRGLWATTWMDQNEVEDYQDQWGKRAALPHLWDERVTTKVIYDFDSDRIILGTQATLPDLPDGKIVGEYVDGKVILYEADRQWINPTYFRRLWAFSFPGRELKDVYFRRSTGDEYMMRSLPRKRKQDAVR